MALVPYAPYPNIVIDDNGGGASTFLLTVREALVRIASQPKGLQLLQELQQYTPVFQAWGGGVKIYRAAVPIAMGGSKAVAISENGASSGGTSSGVAWNSNVQSIPGQGPRPPFVGLAHELIHAWHNARGTKRATYDDEENFTVGLGQHMIPTPGAITENMIRLEHNVPIRHVY